MFLQHQIVSLMKADTIVRYMPTRIYGDQIDDFCIHPDELEENDDIKHWGKVNIDGSYRYYVENGVISPENSDI